MKLEPNPKGLVDDLRIMRDLGVETIYYGGYGYATFHFAAAFKELDWDPPRVMGTAFMFYSNSNAWAEGLEGWHGVDQLGEDGANPNYNAMVERFEKRFGRTTRNVVVALAYDTARVAIHGIGNAAIPHPRWVKEGWSGSAGCRPPTAVPAPTSSSARTIARATRATSSRSGSCATASSASTGTTGPSGRRTTAPSPAVSGKVYIHELIDIIGHNRARYLHHMTANWCPVAREERNQLCLGVWATLGSTGRWPEVVNMWELDGWDGLAANFAHETAGGRDQDPSLAEWWAAARRCAAAASTASSCPRLGPDRWSSSPPTACAARCTPTSCSRSRRDERRAARRGRARGPRRPCGASVSSRWVPTRWPWPTTPRHCSCGRSPTGRRGSPTSGRGRPTAPLAPWRKTLLGLGASWRRQLLIDSPLNPLRTGRQPQVSDRRPLDQI